MDREQFINEINKEFENMTDEELLKLMQSIGLKVVSFEPGKIGRIIDSPYLER